MNAPHERITLRIPTRIHETIKTLAANEHVSLNSYIVRALAKIAPKPTPPSPQKAKG